MFSPDSFSKKALLAQRAFSLFFLLCLVTGAAVFIGCDLDGDDNENTGFIPAGEWVDAFGNGYDITSTKIKYYTAAWGNPGDDDYYPPSEFEGNIEEAVDFSDTSGVLIIQVTGTPSTGHTTGKYTAIYYKDFTTEHIFLANPIDNSYVPIETDNSTDALNMFTEGNMGTYVQDWGSGYTK
jgi:hypothetical protein